MSSILPSMRSSRSLRLGSSTNALILCGTSLSSCYQVLVWHHCRQVFSSCSATVPTFPVFPSWMYLLGGDVSCMFSVPSSTCDLHICCWQSGEICQATEAAALTLFNYELWSSPERGWSPFHFALTLRPSARVFRCHRASWKRGRAGICAGSRECFSLLLLLDFSVLVDCCKVIQASIEQILVKRRRNVKDWQLR